MGGGYEFVGWATVASSKEVEYKDEAAITVTADITLYAVWKKKGTEQPAPGKKTFTVKFNANAPEGTSASGTMEAQTFTEGTEQSLTKNAFTIEGYKFIGWAESPEAAEAKYTDGQEIPVSADITLYALWEEEEDPNAPKFTVTFDGNAPEGETVSGEMTGQIFTEGKSQSLAKNTFAVRKGYAFRGWALDKSATVEKYKDEESIKVPADTTLYAVWDTGLVLYDMRLGNLSLGLRVDGVNEYLTDYLIIPSWIASVNANAFAEGCDIVKTIEVQTNLNAYAGVLSNMKNLETLIFTSEMESFGFSTLKGCSNLKKFVVDDANEAYKASDDGRMVLSKDGTNIYAVLKDPTGKATTLENTRLLYDNKQDQSTVFVNCEHLVLRNVAIDADYSFGQTQASADTPNTLLKTVVFENVTDADVKDFDPSNMFWKCVALESADLSGCSTVERMLGTFADCTNLKTAKLPETMRDIDGTFDRCTSLTEFNIPASVTKMSSDLGEGNGRNVSVTYSKTIDDYKMIRNNDAGGYFMPSAFGGKVNVTVTCSDGKVIYTADSNEIKVERNE